MQLVMSTRSKEQDNTDYLAIQEHGLETIIENEGYHRLGMPDLQYV